MILTVKMGINSPGSSALPAVHCVAFQPFLGQTHRSARTVMMILLFQIIFIRSPIERIIDDIFPNFIQFIFITDNMFIIISLPQFSIKGFPTVLFDHPNVFIRRHRFVPLHNFPLGRTCVFAPISRADT